MVVAMDTERGELLRIARCGLGLEYKWRISAERLRELAWEMIGAADEFETQFTETDP